MSRRQHRLPPEGAVDPELSLQRVLARQEETLGMDHPHVILSLHGLARLRVAQGRLADTLPLLERALVLSEQHLRQECVASHEARLAQVLPEFQEEAVRLYSLALDWPDDARVRNLALAAALLRKSLPLETLAHLSRTLYRELRREDREPFELLRTLRTALSTLRLVDPGARPPREYRQSLEAASSQCDTLEANLATRSPALRWLREQPSPTELPLHVAAALPRDGALVELVAFRQLPPSPLRYLALLLLSNGSTHAVDLGLAEPMDAAAILLHRALTSRSNSCLPAAQALHESTFRPLLPYLGRVRRLFIAADGWLALVPFAELHDGRHFLSDTFDITQLASGRDLLPGPEGLPRKQPVLFLTGLELNPPRETPS